MLKKILASLALTVGIIHPSIASEKSLMVSFEAPCVDVVSLEKVLDKHGEDPALTMISTREIGSRYQAVPTVFFINPKTKSWTLVEKVADNLYCVIAVGQEVAPYFEKDKK